MACCSHNHEECEVKEKNKSKIVFYILSLVLFGIGFIPALTSYKIWIYLVAVLFAGYDLLIEGIKNLVKFNFEESTLMTIAIIGAFIKGDYPESCLVVLLFKLGEFLEEFAEARSNKNIEDITKIKANNANLVDGDTVNVVKVEDVKIGDILLVKPGEKIPVDGIVTAGTSQIDTSPITGESKPVKAEKNNEVISGSINLNSAIYIKAEKEYKDSMASQIIDLVYEATTNKGKTEKFITKFSKIYTPIVIAIAVLLVIIPLILGADMDKWIDIALFFLVASCPCSLVISIPLSFFSCIGAISKKGMIIKGTKHIENLSKTDIIAFDKTGTLTTGKMVIDKLEATKIPENEMLEYIYSIESLSNHPIATAVANYKKDIEKLEVKDYIEYSGHGLYGIINGKEILFGNKKLMEKYNVDTAEYVDNTITLAVDKQIVGYITLKEELRENVENILDKLREAGVKDVAILTGDNKKAAKNIADKLKISKVYAELLPQEKLNKVRELQANKKKVTFLGDGFNDSPVIATADFGMSMGTGSEIANSTADGILISNDISILPTIIRIAKKTMRIVKFNITFSLLAKLVVLIVGLFGTAPIWLAVLADTGVTLLTVLNALRIFRK